MFQSQTNIQILNNFRYQIFELFKLKTYRVKLIWMFRAIEDKFINVYVADFKTLSLKAYSHWAFAIAIATLLFLWCSPSLNVNSNIEMLWTHF